MDIMDKLFVGLGVVAGTVGLLLLAPLIGVLFGALSGWVVGWFFSETILAFFAALGVKGLAMWQIGAALGFVSGFLRPKVFSNNG